MNPFHWVAINCVHLKSSPYFIRHILGQLFSSVQKLVYALIIYFALKHGSHLVMSNLTYIREKLSHSVASNWMYIDQTCCFFGIFLENNFVTIYIWREVPGFRNDEKLKSEVHLAYMLIWLITWLSSLVVIQFDFWCFSVLTNKT
jgi:hypothetical protein